MPAIIPIIMVAAQTASSMYAAKKQGDAAQTAAQQQITAGEKAKQIQDQNLADTKARMAPYEAAGQAANAQASGAGPFAGTAFANGGRGGPSPTGPTQTLGNMPPPAPSGPPDTGGQAPPMSNGGGDNFGRKNPAETFNGSPSDPSQTPWYMQGYANQFDPSKPGGGSLPPQPTSYMPPQTQNLQSLGGIQPVGMVTLRAPDGTVQSMPDGPHVQQFIALGAKRI